MCSCPELLTKLVPIAVISLAQGLQCHLAMHYRVLLALLPLVGLFSHSHLAHAETLARDTTTLTVQECGGIYFGLHAPMCTLRQRSSHNPACGENSMLVSCTATLTKSCTGRCDAPAEPSCVASCQSSCDQMCDHEFTSCKANCQGDCAGDCATACAGHADPTQCQASCSMHCAQGCDAACAKVDGLASCPEQCQASCEGACLGEANRECQLECQGEGFPGCTAEFQNACEARLGSDQAPIYCDGQYVHADEAYNVCLVALRNRQWFDDQQPECGTDCSIGATDTASLTSLGAILILISGLLVARGRPVRIHAKRALGSRHGIADTSNKPTTPS